MPPWIEPFLLAFIPLFVAIDPIGLTPIYLGMSQGISQERRNLVTNEAVITAFLVAVGFLFLGKFTFRALNITENDFRIAGGLILFGISARDILNSDRGSTDTHSDFGVVPLGMPIIAGPGTLTTILATVSTVGVVVTLIALVANLLLVLLAFRSSPFLQRVLGLRTMRAIAKIVSLLLAAIAVNLVRRGLQGA